ncbi:putative lipoprotein [Lysobacter dokdonensis DS-58]|uniref:Putative lipoprotein n=1 Tax=Lysobacter dokdonensis DS-58 TaxID=1300345 RepID=A0A0A2WFV6_9GAMM|nr:hypothetical protein [Lysobacter dokdonensis]KGQ19081.1 putative lipoprotein [Lysobacter dokdonensis DS-58]
MQFHRRALGLCFALLSLFFVANVQARESMLVDPAAVAIPAGMTDEQVVKDIKRALTGRGWVITAEQPGQIDAELNLREHWAKIKVVFDGKTVQYSYVDSRNLDFKVKRGQRYIHRNYLGWMSYVQKDTSTNLQLTAGQL